MPMATMPLDRGRAALQWPERVSTTDIADLREWCEIVFRVMEREAARAESEAAAADVPSEAPPPLGADDEVIDAEAAS